jgi:hypothetical protein
MHAQPQNIQFLQEEASPPPPRAIHSMRRTLSWCYPAFRQIRRVIVVDLYAIALERPPGRSFYFVENGEATFLQAAQAIALQLEVGGPKPYSGRSDCGSCIHAAYTFGSTAGSEPGAPGLSWAGNDGTHDGFNC